MKKLIAKFFGSVWHKLPQKISQLIATLVATVFFLCMGSILLPTPTAQAAMVLYCDGLDYSGNPYKATYVDGLFPKILFIRPGFPPINSELTYDTVNSQGEPIYRGSYLGAADVVLIDLSKGNVKTGSEISVAVDNLWNIQRGICGIQ